MIQNKKTKQIIKIFQKITLMKMSIFKIIKRKITKQIIKFISKNNLIEISVFRIIQRKINYLIILQLLQLQKNKNN